MLFGNSAALMRINAGECLMAQYFYACGRSRSRSKRAGGAVTTGVPRRFVKNALKNEIWRFQPAFFTQNLHQPSGLILPSTSVQALGSLNSEQLLHF